MHSLFTWIAPSLSMLGYLQAFQTFVVILAQISQDYVTCWTGTCFALQYLMTYALSSKLYCMCIKASVSIILSQCLLGNDLFQSICLQCKSLPIQQIAQLKVQ